MDPETETGKSGMSEWRFYDLRITCENAFNEFRYSSTCFPLLICLKVQAALGGIPPPNYSKRLPLGFWN
jgi:hypothetical protein